MLLVVFEHPEYVRVWVVFLVCVFFFFFFVRYCGGCFTGVDGVSYLVFFMFFTSCFWEVGFSRALSALRRPV